MPYPENPFAVHRHLSCPFSSSSKVTGDALMEMDKDRGWLGADAAYNCMLPDGRRLWVFGDTLIGRMRNNKREVESFVRTSVGVEAADGTMSYYWGGEAEETYKQLPMSEADMHGEVGSLFTNEREGEWYWPADVVMAEGKACFFMRRLKHLENDPHMYEVVGNDLVVVKNPADAPEQWHFSTVPINDSHRTAGLAADVKDDYVYFIESELKEAVHKFQLARIPVSDFLRKPGEYEYLDTQTRAWGKSYPSVYFMEAGAPEASLTWDEEKKNWRIIHTYRDISPYIVMRESRGEDIAGSWKPTEKLHRAGGMDTHERYQDYAAKEVKGTRELTFLYITNSVYPPDLRDNPEIYRPRLMTVAREKKRQQGESIGR